MVSSKEEILRYLTLNKEQLFDKFNLSKLGLIGSFARNEATANSDIDIIVDFQPETEGLFLKKENMRHLLKTQFDRDIDICTEKYIKPYFKDQILKSAVYV